MTSTIMCSLSPFSLLFLSCYEPVWVQFTQQILLGQLGELASAVPVRGIVGWLPCYFHVVLMYFRVWLEVIRSILSSSFIISSLANMALDVPPWTQPWVFWVQALQLALLFTGPEQIAVHGAWANKCWWWRCYTFQYFILKLTSNSLPKKNQLLSIKWNSL